MARARTRTFVGAAESVELAPPRAVSMQYLTGRALYERVIRDGIQRAKVSVWIATANLKEVLVEPPPALRVTARDAYVPSLDLLGHLAGRGVEVRILHSGIPSQAFARSLVKHRALLRPRGAQGTLDPALALRRCPRVHFKTVVVDGAMAYLGSANWTGAGLGAKGEGRRNFEVGFVSDDEGLLDDVQALYERVWSGRACKGCRLREQCPAPLDELHAKKPAAK